MRLHHNRGTRLNWISKRARMVGRAGAAAPTSRSAVLIEWFCGELSQWTGAITPREACCSPSNCGGHTQNALWSRFKSQAPIRKTRCLASESGRRCLCATLVAPRMRACLYTVKGRALAPRVSTALRRERVSPTQAWRSAGRQATAARTPFHSDTPKDEHIDQEHTARH